jgi:hypothetical protein
MMNAKPDGAANNPLSSTPDNPHHFNLALGKSECL